MSAPAATLDRLKISPEVGYFLDTRGIPLPDCPPLIKTPEPRDVEGAMFDPERVDKVLAAFRALRHTQGQWAGKPLVPDPWQVAYVIAPWAGWVRWDDDAQQHVRIITDVYVDVPRKNGKSTIAGGISTYMLAGDGEPGAQIVAAATTQAQAGFVFGPIKQLAQNSPALKKHVKAMQKRIVHPRSGSYFEVIANVADAQHGANLHAAIVDELHVHKDGELVKTLETGRGSRTQPLVLIITTADEGKPNTIYAERRKRVEDVAAGRSVMPHVYGVVWAAEAEDDPYAEATWRKANPGYGVSPTRSYLETAATNAKQSPADLSAFLRLHLGIRTKQNTRYITLEEWRRNIGRTGEEHLAGRTAFGGLDLGNVADLTALCWLFPDGTGYDARWRFWLPEERVDDLNRRTNGAMDAWIRDGWVHTTPGATTDYDFVIEQVRQDRETFKVRQIAYDPWNANQLTKQLADERAPLVEVRQGYKSMSPALKECKRLLAAGTHDEPLLRSGGNPVMEWMTDNLAVAMDPAGNVKPDKATANDKIDGWSALVTCMSRAMHYRIRRSAYAS